ncbi:Zinc finger, RING/FYVE/PHD-type [Artemisia annua]|uniref:RING-type E3 ubiquitin transferase n=1 Tax=Artemisia annua TaxID=35608 RepID=A0A2U1N0J5_ARTAN|nr:Zinc finger, RING/FYVE/PHD-type [Artemisia annua]
MLAAIISLLLVILFILLLHLYTRWFLNHARTRSHTSATVPHVLQTRLHHRFTIIDTSDQSSTKLGLPFDVISSLPLFVYKLHNEDGNDNKLNDRALECAICLSLFEDNEIGRKLPGCNHAFHVECIDMWLHSHSTCPICRSSIQHASMINKKVEFGDLEQNVNELEIIHSDDQDSQSRLLEIVTVNPDQIDQVDDISDMLDVCPSSGSSKKLPSGGNSSIGGKIHPVSDMHEDESEV